MDFVAATHAPFGDILMVTLCMCRTSTGKKRQASLAHYMFPPPGKKRPPLHTPKQVEALFHGTSATRRPFLQLSGGTNPARSGLVPVTRLCAPLPRPRPGTALSLYAVIIRAFVEEIDLLAAERSYEYFRFSPEE